MTEMKMEPSYQVGEVLPFRQQVPLNVDFKWLEAKADTVKQSLITDYMKEKMQYQVDAIRSMYANEMKFLIDSYAEMAAIEACKAKLARDLAESQAEIEALEGATNE